MLLPLRSARLARAAHRVASTTISPSSSIRMSSTSTPAVDGVVLAIGPDGKPYNTAAIEYATKANAIASSSSGDLPAQLAAQWTASRAQASKPSQLRVFYPTSGSPADAPAIAAVSIGTQRPAPSTAPDALPEPSVYLRNELLERTRLAAAKGVRAIKDLGAPHPPTEGEKKTTPTPRAIAVDEMYSPHAAAVGANLALYHFNHFKTLGGVEKAGYKLDASLQGGAAIKAVPASASQEGGKDEHDELLAAGAGSSGEAGIPQLSWKTGAVYAKAQNWARELKETPANKLTPSIFAQRIVDAFKGLPNTQVIVHDEDWARKKGMNVFLSVTQGTEEPAKFVEIIYNGAAAADAPKLGFVGKGVCFDTGGISIKGAAAMDLMRSDMGGAAAVVSTIRAIAELQLPINVVGATPLVENMPSGTATKPGDVFEAMNGLTVNVLNTDAEGRLILSDALTHVSREYKPHTLIDVATLTGAILHALGHVYSGVFVEDESLWQELKRAGEAEHDRFWRMPLDDEYMHSIDHTNADLANQGRPAGSATAAIFLKQFVEGLEDRSKLKEGSQEGRPTVRYAHIDIAGTSEPGRALDYQPKNLLTGRPTRALIEFARRFAVLHAPEVA